MQRVRAPQPPNMYGGDTNLEPSIQIPRTMQNPSALQRQPSVIVPQQRRPPYKFSDDVYSIKCRFGFNTLLNIIKVFIAEFLGTTILMFIGCSGLIISPITFGIAIAIGVQTFGNISGAHLNPAVTIIALIMGKINNILLVPFYIVAQFAGAFVGYAFYYAITAKNSPNESMCAIGYEVDHQGKQFGQEFLMSIFYLMAICAMWDNHPADQGQTMPLKRGLMYTGILLCIRHFDGIMPQQISMISMNCLRALVPAAFHFTTEYHWKAHWIFWVGPNVAAIVAGLLYRFLKWLHKKTTDE